MNSKVCIVLADGFEEAEALIPADIFARLGIEVTFLGLKDLTITGAHNFKLCADKLLKDINILDYNALILPGGLKGTINLRDSDLLKSAILKAYQNDLLCCAICAAPIVLFDSGITKGKIITGYPDCEKLAQTKGCQFSGSAFEISDNIITAKALGKAFEFAKAIAQSLGYNQSDITAVLDGIFY